MPLRHGLSGVPAFASIAPGNGCAAPPIPRRCIQNAAKPPIHGLFIDGQGSGEKLRASDSELVFPLQVRVQVPPLKKIIFL